MVNGLNFELSAIDSEGSALRASLIERGIAFLEKEHLEIPVYTDDQVIEFALEWNGVDGVTTKSARRLLNTKVVDGKVLDWVAKNYSVERLYTLYEFTMYCNWIDAKEVVQHFGDFLRVFMTIEGVKPSWCYVPFHVLLHVGYIEIWRTHRTKIVREWLSSHWEEAVDHFENNRGLLESLPKLQGLEYHHVYTQYLSLRRKMNG